MPPIYLKDLRLNVVEQGSKTGPAVVFINGLGTDISLWDEVIALLPEGLRLVTYDMRGHGASDVPSAPYSMGALVSDCETVMDHLQIKDAVLVGVSLGGMVAQGLATKRLDLVRGLVLSNTAARIATTEIWQARMDQIISEGYENYAAATVIRQFGRHNKDHPAVPKIRAVLMATPVEGWAGCAAAIAGTDFYTSTAALTLPTLAIAGSNDGSTPPDLVRETAELIKGSKFHLMRGAGHLPMAEKPEEYATILTDFLDQIGHISL
jgi:3-oxoadipate enol-lactonase